MKVVIYGANGMLGPHVVKALEGRHELLLTDVKPPPGGTAHPFQEVDVADLDRVVEVAQGMDAIINLSVLRGHRRLAFDVKARGCYNVMTAAVTHGIRRVINTGPHFTVLGPTYEEHDFLLGPDLPPQPGTLLYAITKSLGQEICRVFSENHDVYVITLLFYNFREEDDRSAVGQDFTPFSVTWSDAAQAFVHALEVDLAALPSRCEVFNIFTDIPHDKFSNEKAKRLLGWRPTHRLEQFWRKAD